MRFQNAAVPGIRWICIILSINIRPASTLRCGYVDKAHGILIFLASKHMHNFPLHLSCVATLPDNTLATE